MPALVLRFTSFFAACLACGASRPLEPVDFVNPNIGTIGHLLRATTPTVQLPHGMARVAPVTSPRIRDRYLADKIYGFPAGAATLMPTATEETTPEKIASSFDHDFETATPYYYAVDLEDNRIKAEVTTTAQAIHYRFTFPPASRPRLLLTMSRRGKLELPAPSAVSGHQPQSRMPPYFWAEFTPASESHETRPSGDAIVLRLQPGATIAEVRIGLSYISAEQARHERAKVKLGGVSSSTDGPGWDDLPVHLKELIDRSLRLQERVIRLDAALRERPEAGAGDNPIARDLGRIAEAFGGRK